MTSRPRSSRWPIGSWETGQTTCTCFMFDRRGGCSDYCCRCYAQSLPLNGCTCHGSPRQFRRVCETSFVPRERSIGTQEMTNGVHRRRSNPWWNRTVERRIGAHNRPRESSLRKNWSYLVHWTRRQAGPWPDQSEQDYLRQLLFDFPAADRSARAALQRILTTQRIVATNRLTRSPVAWSACRNGAFTNSHAAAHFVGTNNAGISSCTGFASTGIG